MTPKFFRVPPNISGTGNAANVKFGTHIHKDSLNKARNYFSRKGGVALSRDSQIFRVPPNISGIDKATNIKFGVHIDSERINKSPQYFFPKSWRGAVT